ncbi:hypothetical protein [Fusobacterium sp. PH5-44]|uniref:hypothetical protein n=1 Tax=unclassified Fusobacterium TaxID=2648384 RepID=UPI003D1BB0A5
MRFSRGSCSFSEWISRVAGIYDGVKIYRTPTVGTNTIGYETSKNSNSQILEQLKTYMKNGTKNGKNFHVILDSKGNVIDSF